MLDKIVKTIAGKPTEIIEGIINFLAIYVGLFSLTPWFVSSTQSAATIILNGDIAIIGYALWLLGWGLAGFYALLMASWPYRKKVRKWTSLALCISLIWFTILRLVIFGLGEVVWVPIFCLALVEAVLYVRIGWEKNPHGDVDVNA